MYLYIAIVFIAELIIFLKIISGIIALDKKITVLNNEVLVQTNTLKIGLEQFKKFASSLEKSVATIIERIKQKQREYRLKMIQSIVMYSGMLFLKGKYKKAAIIFQLIVEIIDYIRDNQD